MKARIPVKLKKEAMAEINRLADREYQKVKDKEINDLTRRIFKTIVFALYKDFGFGRDRCAKALKSMTEIIEHSDTDEVFWEHIDRVVIDKLKLEFDRRDYTDNGKVVNFEGDEVLPRPHKVIGKPCGAKIYKKHIYFHCRSMLR